MFDRPIIAPPGRSHTEYVTREVHEHRAPTDESVKLLREMEGKARDEIVKAVHVGDTMFDCVVHQHRHMEDMSEELVAIFSLGGRKMTVQYRGRAFESDVAKAIKNLRDKMAEEIANEILMPALRNFRP